MSRSYLDKLVYELTDLTETARNETTLSGFDLRQMLRFLSKVVQIVEQSFQDVLAIMIEFKYVTESDINSGKLAQLGKEIELLQVRSKYRDAEELCSRLHHLTEYFHEQIEPITANLPNREKWRELLYVLDEHEGYIIGLVGNSVEKLERLLRKPDITEIKFAAAEGVDEIKISMNQLRSLSSQILGYSGEVGLLELAGENEPDRKIDLNVKMGDVYNISGQAGAVGPNAQAHNITQIGNQIAGSIDLMELSKDLSQLRQAMKKEAITAENDIAVSEIARAEQAAKSNNPPKVAEYLKAAGKWALDVAIKVGTPVAVEAIKQAIGIK